MAHLDISSVLNINPRFKSIKNHLTLPRVNRNLKHCSLCGEQLPANANHLKKHWLRNHNDIENSEAIDMSFLTFGELPKDCKFENFIQYLENEDEALRLKPLVKKKVAGRPRMDQ